MIETPFFGQIHYSNLTGVTNKTIYSQVLDYNPDKNQIELNFDGYEDLENWKGFYIYEVTLFDMLNANSTYRGNITIVGPKKEVYVPTWKEIPIKVTAYIVNVTKYGEAYLKFSRPMDTVGVDLKHINSSVLDIYI